MNIGAAGAASAGCCGARCHAFCVKPGNVEIFVLPHFTSLYAARRAFAATPSGSGAKTCTGTPRAPGRRNIGPNAGRSRVQCGTRPSNNAQIITMGARIIGPELAKTIVDAWLDSSFDPLGSSADNVAAIDRLDPKYAKHLG
jgi:Ribose/Galactose Isomerase